MGEQIVQAAQQHKAWHMVGYHKRSDPATVFAKVEIDRLKQTGELGRLTYVRITMPAGDWIANGFIGLINAGDPQPQLDFDPPDHDLSAGDNAAYVRFVNYYIHQVNLLRRLLGEPYKVTYADPSGVLLAGHSEGGVPCLLEMSLYQTTIDWQETALVSFERGTVKLDLPAPVAQNRPGRVELFRDPGNGATPQTIVPQLPWVHAHRQQAINFLRAINSKNGEMKPMCDSVEALEDLKIARDYLRLCKANSRPGRSEH
jgi:predicted dehydrogenase